MTSIGQHLRASRERAGLSLRDLARISGVSAASISRLETGWENVTLDVMRALTDALRLDIELWFRSDVGTAGAVNVIIWHDTSEDFVVSGRRAA
jgi:transcriptional regulator with XRE-family HTH domain